MFFFYEGPWADALIFNLQSAEKANDPADHGDGVMVAFALDPDDLPKIEVGWPDEASILPPVDWHVTLCFLGSAATLEESGLMAEHVLMSLHAFAEEHQPISGFVNGWGRFNGDDADAIYLNFDSAELPAFRQALVEKLALVAPTASDHGFTPHITLAYVPKGSAIDMIEMPAKIKLHFDNIVLAWGDQTYPIPLHRPEEENQR